MFIEVTRDDGEVHVVNTDYIVEMVPNGKDFDSGAIVKLAKDSAGFSSLHVKADEAARLCTLLVNLR